MPSLPLIAVRRTPRSALVRLAFVTLVIFGLLAASVHHHTAAAPGDDCAACAVAAQLSAGAAPQIAVLLVCLFTRGFAPNYLRRPAIVPSLAAHSRPFSQAPPILP